MSLCKASNSQSPHAFLSRKYKSPMPGCLRSEGAASHAIFLLFTLLLTASCNVIYLTTSKSFGLLNDIFFKTGLSDTKPSLYPEKCLNNLEKNLAS